MFSQYVCSTILFLIEVDRLLHSHARRHRATREVHRDLYARRRHNTAIKTIQVCLREGDCHVCLYPLFFFCPGLRIPTTARYAYFKKLDYFSMECVYSPDAYCGHARAFLKDLEAARPSTIIDIIHSGEAFEVKDEVRTMQKMQCMYLSLALPLPSD
jgi:hypothetical protein